jgi:hypothetical protein
LCEDQLETSDSESEEEEEEEEGTSTEEESCDTVSKNVTFFATQYCGSTKQTLRSEIQ